MKFWNFNNANSDIVELRIEGDIIDNELAWLYEWYGDLHASPNKFRQALEEHNGKELHVYVDSYGGSVFAGAGLYSAIKAREGKTIGIVHSKAMSAGTMPLMACDEVWLSPVSTLMIHDPITSLYDGGLADFEKTVKTLNTIKESIINAYELKTGLSRQRISNLMTEETFMDAEKAVSLGFADKILTEETSITNSFTKERIKITNSATEGAIKEYLKCKNQEEQREKDSEIEMLSLWLETA